MSQPIPMPPLPTLDSAAWTELSHVARKYALKLGAVASVLSEEEKLKRFVELPSSFQNLLLFESRYNLFARLTEEEKQLKALQQSIEASTSGLYAWERSHPNHPERRGERVDAKTREEAGQQETGAQDPQAGS